MIIVARKERIYEVSASCSTSVIPPVLVYHWLIFNVFHALPRAPIERIYWPTNGINCERCYVFVKSPDTERWIVNVSHVTYSHIVLSNFARDRHCQQSTPTFQWHANILFENLIKSTRHSDSLYALAILFTVSFISQI